MKASSLTKETILDKGIEDRNFPSFNVGDTIEVAQIVKDGDKQRIQMFKGDVIAAHKNGIASTFTVRKIGANGVGVEKIFPYYSKNVDGVKVIKTGKVRRAKLNYIRDRIGKAARVKERILSKEQLKKTLASAPSAKQPVEKKEPEEQVTPQQEKKTEE